MGKPKNKSKGQDVEDLSDIELDKAEEESSKPAPKQSKKDKRKKKKDDDWEDDIANELATLSIETNKGKKDPDEEGEEPVVVNKKEKKKKKKQKQEDSADEADEEIMPSVQKSKKKAAFSMLMDDDEDSGDAIKSPSDSEEEVKPVKSQPEPAKKKKEKKKSKTQEAEDIDALLAEIEKPKEKSGKKSKKDKKKEAMEEAMMEAEQINETEKVPEGNNVEKTEPKVVTMEDLENEDDDKKKKKKKKGKDKNEESVESEETPSVEKTEPKVVTMEDLEDDEEEDKKKKKKKKGKKGEEDEEKENIEGEDEEEGTVKTAAQKRKEKKEREKEKKKADKIKESKKKENEKTEEKKEEKEKTPEEAVKTAGEDKASGDEVEEEGKKKKKEKKKKGEKEEKKDDKKKKTKAPISAIKELLRKQKEEEERLQQEEEEKIRLEEEAIAAAIEKKRLDEEKRLKKKEKEKEKRDRLKAEGKFLTAQQKADKKRAMQMLESMKAQGIKVPSREDVEVEKKKRPVYGKERKKKKQEPTDGAGTSGDSAREETPTPIVEESKPAETVVEKEKEAADEVSEEWDAGEEIKEEWDVSSEEEEEESEEKESSPETETKVQVEVKAKQEIQKKEEEEESEDEDESEEEEESDSEEESESESESDEDDLTPYERAEIKIKKNHEKCESQRSTDVLRAPVVCVLGHVDTGKTKILDKLRRTNVQDGEAGGITQQIGATNVPRQAILDKTTMCKEFLKKELKLPGLLIIDTPGHESFSNLRSRGSSLCDIAILVIDIMHGLEPQTIESINLLKDRKTPFVVALNKIDRLYQWKSNPNSDVVNTLKKQTVMCKSEFDERSQAVKVQLAEQGLNSALFYENKNPKEYISLIPTSAHSGDGMGNLLALICELTQNWLAKKVSFTEELHATVMEVKALPGLGTTIDVILVNGKLREGDQIVIAGTEGPIVTQIRGLLMPQPMKELRVKGQYDHHKEVLAAQGVKIIGKELEKSLAGLPLYVAHNEDEVEYYKEELSDALKDVLGSIKLSERGVFVQASTLGSLEALLEFLRTSNIPYAGINIGPVHRKDIMKASIMLEHDSQWAVILAFDVKIERDAQEMADSLGVRIFTADIIYHLEDKFMKFREDLKRQKQEEFKNIAVFPCKLRILPQFIFNQRDPIVVGVSVEAGIAKVGSPLCVPSKEFVEIGTISSIENNHKNQDTARRGEEVCIKIENTSGDAPKLYGRHFDHEDLLVSKISRTSIDAVKEHFRDDMTKPDWALMVELKKTFQIL